MSLGTRPATRKRRQQILDWIKDGSADINAPGGRAALAKRLRVAPMQVSRDLKALRYLQGPASGIAVMKRGRPKSKKSEPARTAHDAHAAQDYAREHMDGDKSERVGAMLASAMPLDALSAHMATLADTTKAESERAILQALIGDGTLTSDAHLRILNAAQHGIPPSIYHATLQFALERTVQNIADGSLSPADESLALSRILSRQEAAIQLAQGDGKLPNLVQVNVNMQSKHMPESTRPERVPRDVTAVGHVIQVE